MITKFEQYNEGIKHLLVGPTKEQAWTELINGKLKGFIDSIPETREDFFNQMKDGCEIIENSEGCISFGKNGIELFREYTHNKILDVSYRYIWSVLDTMYDLNFEEVQSFIKEQLLEDNNWTGLNPFQLYRFT